jgi:hypothetical protein
MEMMERKERMVDSESVLLKIMMSLKRSMKKRCTAVIREIWTAL